MFSKSLTLIALGLSATKLIYHFLKLCAFLLNNIKLIVEFVVNVLDTGRSHILLEVC